MELSVSLSCLFVHEPPCQTTVVCCNPVFHHDYLCMDHPTVFTRFPRKCGAYSGSLQYEIFKRSLVEHICIYKFSETHRQLNLTYGQEDCSDRDLLLELALLVVL